MDILAALEHSKSEALPIATEQHQHTGEFMHPEVFRIALYQAGCDEETIEDCLFEPCDSWDFLLKYFEGKLNVD